MSGGHTRGRRGDPREGARVTTTTKQNTTLDGRETMKTESGEDSLVCLYAFYVLVERGEGGEYSDVEGLHSFDLPTGPAATVQWVDQNFKQRHPLPSRV